MLMSVYAASSSQQTDSRNAHAPLFSMWPSPHAAPKMTTYSRYMMRTRRILRRRFGASLFTNAAVNKTPTPRRTTAQRSKKAPNVESGAGVASNEISNR